MRSLAPPAVRHPVVAALLLAGILLTAPWPALQGLLHVILVLGLAPQAGSLLGASLWSLAAGWTLEGALHTYPHLGGTPLADLTLTLAAVALFKQWAPERLTFRLGQLALLVLLHTLAVHLAVRFACGPHLWGTAWLWSLLTLPVWGSLVHRFQAPPYAK